MKLRSKVALTLMLLGLFFGVGGYITAFEMKMLPGLAALFIGLLCVFWSFGVLFWTDKNDKRVSSILMHGLLDFVLR